MTYKDLNNTIESMINSGRSIEEEVIIWHLYHQCMRKTEFIIANKEINEYYVKKKDDDFYTLKDFHSSRTFRNFEEKGVSYNNIGSGCSYVFFDDYFIVDQYDGLALFTRDGKIPEDFFNYIEFFGTSPSIKVITGMTNSGLYSLSRKIKKIEYKDIEGNYNTDLPLDKIKKFVEEDTSSGLIILHGIPGTGKSYLLRYLINHYHGIKQFSYIDSNDFHTLCTNKQYLRELKDTILILEDCEALIKDRNLNNFNSNISNLLNISDGLLGDALNVKIICTFNTQLENIDKALLRKGRIKLKYEFKELTPDIAKKVCLKYNKKYIGKNLLCDILNEEDTGVTERSKIGF